MQTTAGHYLRNDVMQVVDTIALCLYGEIFMRNLFIYANHANSQDLKVGMPEGMNAHPAIIDRRRRTGFLLTSLVASFL